MRHYMRKLILSSAGVIAGLGAAILASEPPAKPLNINNEVFNVIENASYLDKYTVDENGDIIDGPRADVGEPIDYSYLLSRTEIKSIFLRTAFGLERGLEELDLYPDRIQKRDASKRVSIKFITEELEFLNSQVPYIKEFFQDIIKVTNIDFRYDLKEATDNDIFIVVGNAAYLESNLREILTGRKEPYMRDVLTKKLKSKSPYCVGFNFNNKDNHLEIATSIVFVDIDYFKRCLNEEVLQTFGLFKDSDLNFSSIYNDHSNYITPTVIDWKILGLLYNEQITAGDNYIATSDRLDHILHK